MAPKRTFGKSTSGPTATPQSNAPPGNGHRYDAAEKIWDGDPMTMSLWFVQTIEDLQDADPKFNRLVESATALTAKGQKIAVLSAEHAQSDLNGTIAMGTFLTPCMLRRSDFASGYTPFGTAISSEELPPASPQPVRAAAQAAPTPGDGATPRIVWSGVRFPSGVFISDTCDKDSSDRCRGDVFPFGGSGCRRTSVRPPAAADP